MSPFVSFTGISFFPFLFIFFGWQFNDSIYIVKNVCQNANSSVLEVPKLQSFLGLPLPCWVPCIRNLTTSKNLVPKHSYVYFYLNIGVVMCKRSTKMFKITFLKS